MKISIITATYNSAAHVASCIESVNSQTYPYIEHIIVDGASKDNTVEIIKTIPNRIVKIVSEQDKGIYDAMNKGVKMATGDIVGILNSDDLYTNNDVIETILNEFKNDETLDAIHTNLYYVNSEDTNKIVRHWITGDFTPNSFFRGWHPAHPTLFLRRNVYENFGLFDEQFKLAADFEFMLRIFEKYKIKSKYLPITSVKMRLGGATSKSLTNILKGNRECLKAFKKNGFKTPLLYPFFRILPKFKQFFNKR